jgi:site-specific recombinase XerD
VTHQGQPIRYVEVTLDDIAVANRLAHEVLGRTLDELPPKTRELLRRLGAWVTGRCAAQGMSRGDFRFSRRSVREATRWSDTALKVHLGRLAEMEYLLVHRGGRGQSFEYELLYQGEGEQGEPFLMGLIDPERLRYDAERSGLEGHRSGPGQPLVRGLSGGGPGVESGGSVSAGEDFGASDTDEPRNALLPRAGGNGSYRRRIGASRRSLTDGAPEAPRFGEAAGSVPDRGQRHGALPGAIPRSLGGERAQPPHRRDPRPHAPPLRLLVRRAQPRPSSGRHAPDPRALPAPPLPRAQGERRDAQLRDPAAAPPPREGVLQVAGPGDLVLSNPASEMELPRVHRKLPQHVLTAEEVERILAQTGLHGDLGIRDRAILETLYSTGIRRSELAHLRLYDVDTAIGTLMVRQGKGQKDHMVPLGARAAHWIDRYTAEVRPQLVAEPDPGWLFVHEYGEPFAKNRLTDLVKKYIEKAGVEKPGACHIFRHTMATLTLDAGADIRHIQAILGHSQLSTTEICTQVSIAKLKAVHALTHPAGRVTTAD